MKCLHLLVSIEKRDEVHIKTNGMDDNPVCAEAECFTTNL